MSAVIVGTSLNSGEKVLRKSERTTEVDGLVSLTETYIIRSADIESIEPNRNTPYATFTGVNTYPRMQVETTRVEPMDGGLATLVVNYVGLDYASGLPPAYITTVGQPGVGIFGADTAIVVKYINESSLFDTLKGQVLSLAIGGSNLVLPTKRLMPSAINGTTMPPNPRQREYRRSPTISEVVAASAGQNQGVFFSGSISYYAPTIEWLYAGYVQTGISFKRRGSFNQIEEQFTEYFRGTDRFYTSDGVVNIPAVQSFNRGFNFIF